MPVEIVYPWQIWGVCALLILMFVLYMRVRIPIELSSLSILIALLIFFHLFPLENGEPKISFLLAGFANPALLTVMALLVIGQGMLQSEALDGLTRIFVRLGKNYARFTLGSILILVFATTAWLNNTPVVVMFIPILVALAAHTNAAPDKIMMPLSFVCILGGMTTLIGSSTNILAVDIAMRAGAAPFGFFDITQAGLMLAIPGLIYVLFIMPFLLPQRNVAVLDTPDPDGRHYIAQIDIGADSPLINTHIDKSTVTITDKKHPLNNMRILRVQRGNQSFYPNLNDEVILQQGDNVVVAANREILTLALKSRHDVFGLKVVETDERALVDVVIAPASRMVGRSLLQITLQYETNCHVLGILRRKRMLRSQIQDIRFEAGDVLLIVGSKQAIRKLGHTYDVFLLEWSETDLPHPQQAFKALAIFLSMIVLAATSALPLIIVALSAASLMIISGVLNIRQAIRALDRRLFFLVATAIALASALEITHAPALFAHFATNLVEQPQPFTVFASMFLVIALATNLLSNNAAAILFMPIMLETASLLKLEPTLAIITVILAANCSFATPMAYQTNLLVMGPGRYQFKDFIIAGTPLLLLMWGAYMVMAKTLYGL